MSGQKTYCRTQAMDEFMISRRVIEGYEELGLIRPTAKTDRGSYLYDEETFRRIGFIRLCQKMGFELKDILEFIDSCDEEIERRFIEQSKLIRKQIMNLRFMLKMSRDLMNCENPRNSEKILEIFREEKYL